MIGSDVALSGRPICLWGLESQVLVCQWGQSNQVSRARKDKGVRLREPISRTESNTRRQGPCVFDETQRSGPFEA